MTDDKKPEKNHKGSKKDEDSGPYKLRYDELPKHRHVYAVLFSVGSIAYCYWGYRTVNPEKFAKKSTLPESHSQYP